MTNVTDKIVQLTTKIVNLYESTIFPNLAKTQIKAQPHKKQTHKSIKQPFLLQLKNLTCSFKFIKIKKNKKKN